MGWDGRGGEGRGGGVLLGSCRIFNSQKRAWLRFRARVRDCRALSLPKFGYLVLSLCSSAQSYCHLHVQPGEASHSKLIA